LAVSSFFSPLTLVGRVESRAFTSADSRSREQYARRTWKERNQQEEINDRQTGVVAGGVEEIQ
jgi:hypothetical protein